MTSSNSSSISPFLDPGPVAQADSLAVLHLSRDSLQPCILRELDLDNEGFAEGKVTNTRFGSFPHSTLIGRGWGSQVLASKVDTGSRGRKNPGVKLKDLKRKRGDGSGTSTPKPEETTDSPAEYKTAVTASSGFAHLLPPTPESWTSSLPHRTQVVYTPDYSYILHRLRVRPGSVIIEAGAGSGSFTHAAARAVFNGYPGQEDFEDGLHTSKKRKLGKVYSFEFHEQRVEKIRQELKDHKLEGIVQVNHRDVYNDGFLVNSESDLADVDVEVQEPRANAVFLDLPAPWLALPHLTRARPSALDPHSPLHICTFSPCIEQVIRTVSSLRSLGFVSIEMVELSHKRIEVRRERVGIFEVDGPNRGVLTIPYTVEESLIKLKEQEERARKSREHMIARNLKNKGKQPEADDCEMDMNDETSSSDILLPKAARPDRPVYAAGQLIHRSEPELKTHTSYLVFAILPQEWTDEDEARCLEQYPLKPVKKPEPKKSKRQSQKQSKKSVKKQSQSLQENEIV